MTREETVKLLKTLKIMYPNGFKYKDSAEGNALINAWHTMLRRFGFYDVQSALEQYIKTGKNSFPPTVGEIYKIANSTVELNDLIKEDARKMREQYPEAFARAEAVCRELDNNKLKLVEG